MDIKLIFNTGTHDTWMYFGIKFQLSGFKYGDNSWC